MTITRIVISLGLRCLSVVGVSASLWTLWSVLATSGICNVDSGARYIQSAWWIMIISFALYAWDDWEIAFRHDRGSSWPSVTDRRLLRLLETTSIYPFLRNLDVPKFSEKWAPEYTAAVVFYLIGPIVGIAFGAISVIC